MFKWYYVIPTRVGQDLSIKSFVTFYLMNKNAFS